MTDENQRPPMAEVSHTHPETNQTFGTVYRRGPAVADGGEPDARTEADEQSTESADEDDERAPMREVDHTPREGEGANEVWERGDVDE
jgi:hypothetical protein